MAFTLVLLAGLVSALGALGTKASASDAMAAVRAPITLVAAVCLVATCCPMPIDGRAYADSNHLQVASTRVTTQSTATCAWDDYQWVDGKTTAKKICLTGYARRDGARPDGYVVYRKDPGKKSYKKIAVVRKSSWTMKYTDRKVKFSKRYTYKFRAYHTVGGVKIYGGYSGKVKMRAVNRTGSCKVEFLTERGSTTPSIDMKISSGAKNGKLVFKGSIDYSFNARTGRDEDDVDVSLKISEVSSDGINWKSAPEKVTLAAGKTKYLRLSLDSNSPLRAEGGFVFDPNDADAELSFNNVTYNGFISHLALSFEMTGAAAIIDGEYYH